MDILERNLYTFLDDLSSKSPVPGGGGASALVGSMGAALGHMVGELTVGKKKYAAVEEDIKHLMEEAEKLKVQLAMCVEKDAEAFAPLAKAYGMPKDDPGRDEYMEQCLKAAAAPPLEILLLSCKTLDLLKEFAEKGSTIAVSDAATGAAFCRAAISGAAVNVKVNTRLMKDKEYAKKIDAKVDSAAAKYIRLADSIYEMVYSQY